MLYSRLKLSIKLYAGQNALAEIKEQGLSPKRIRLMVGASGGPKWLMLSRLDQYLCEHFFSQSDQPISLLGSSVGAWRMSCYAQSNPLAAFKRFEDLYTHQRYKGKITADQVAEYADRVLSDLFAAPEIEHIVNNAHRPLHIVAVRNRRIFNSRHPAMQGIALLTAATGNLISPEVVKTVYPRVIISTPGFSAPYSTPQNTIELTRQNLKSALLASGAIPLVLDPAKVEGSKDRWHWDGGIVDYHFTGPFNVDDGLVLYPHFFPKLIPGWFDKALPWRKIRAENYKNVLVICPSQAFIDSLPYKKIPDRNDFNDLSDEEREQYWQTVLERTTGLVDHFHEIMSKDQGRSAVEPIERLLN